MSTPARSAADPSASARAQIMSDAAVAASQVVLNCRKSTNNDGKPKNEKFFAAYIYGSWFGFTNSITRIGIVTDTNIAMARWGNKVTGWHLDPSKGPILKSGDCIGNSKAVNQAFNIREYKIFN